MVKRVGTPILPEYLRILKIEKTAMPSITKRMEPYNITGFSPLGMTGLDLWLDGNDPTTMYNASNGGANVTNNGFVWRWEDKSGNANHVYTTTGGSLSQPQYYANLTNYKGGLTFSNSVLTNLVQAPYPVDMYMVLSLCNYNNIGISALTNANMNVCCIKYPGGSFGSNKDWNSLAYGLMNNPRGINYSQKWVINSSNYSRTCNVVPSVQETSMGFIMINWGISNSDYHINRYTTSLAATTTYSSWATYAASNTAFRYYIGGIDYSATDSNFNGSICEILSFSNLLNVSNRTLVESYLSSKWGLQRNIPVTHPGHLGNFPSYTGYSLDTVDGIRGYDKKVTGNLVYVLGPNTPNSITPQISNTGTLLYGEWSAGTGGAPYYYNVSISNSTDNTTWSPVLSLPTITATNYIYNSLTIDNKYYRFTIEAVNPGGSNTTISASVFNGVPGAPTANRPTQNGVSFLNLSWSAPSTGGTPLNYYIELFYIYTSVRNSGTYTSIYTTSFSSSTFSTVIMPTNTTVPDANFLSGKTLRFTVYATNGTGQGALATSTPFDYPPNAG